MDDMLAMPEFPTNIAGGDPVEDPNKGQEGEGTVTEPVTEPNGQDPADAPKDEQAPAPAEAKDAPKDEPKKEPDAPKQVPTREGKSKEDFILERKRKQLEKLNEQIEAKRKQATDEGIETEDEGDDIADDDKKTIKKVVDQEYGEHFKRLEEQRQEAEFSDFLTKNEAAKHATDEQKALFREYAKHPSRSEVPYETVLVEAMGGFKGILALGAKLEREAAQKAGKTKVAGTQAQQQEPGTVDFDKMNDNDFEAFKQKVRNGG